MGNLIFPFPNLGERISNKLSQFIFLPIKINITDSMNAHFCFFVAVSIRKIKIQDLTVLEGITVNFLSIINK